MKQGINTMTGAYHVEPHEGATIVTGDEGFVAVFAGHRSDELANEFVQGQGEIRRLTRYAEALQKAHQQKIDGLLSVIRHQSERLARSQIDRDLAARQAPKRRHSHRRGMCGDRRANSSLTVEDIVPVPPTFIKNWKVES